MSRSRRFCITNYDLDFSYNKITPLVKYIIVGGETCPTTGRKHHQIYVEFINGKTITSVAKLFNKSHTEIAKGDAKQNITYCTKESTFFFFGEPGQQGKRNDLDDIKSKLDSGIHPNDIADEHFTKWVIYRKAFQEYKQIKEPKRDWVPEVILLIGPSGCGKTRLAKENGAITVHYEKGFVRGYDGEDVILFDDVDKDTFVDRKWWLEALDRYDLKVNIKGGERNWKPRKIYITSNFSVDELFLNDEAFMRRITEIKIFNNNIE